MAAAGVLLRKGKNVRQTFATQEFKEEFANAAGTQHLGAIFDIVKI